MHALSIVTTAIGDTELTEPVSESILAAAQHYLVGADEHAEVRPYVAGEHTAPVRLPQPLVVVTTIEVEEKSDAAYLVHVTGARYREDYGDQHPHSELFTRHGRKGAHGLTIVQAWEDVRVGDAHIIGVRDNSQGGTFLPSGILASRIDLTLRIAVGLESIEPTMPRRARTDAPMRTMQQTSTRQQTRSAGRHRPRPVVDMEA